MTDSSKNDASVPLLEARNVDVIYRRGLGGRHTFQAVRSFDMTIAPGEVMGLVGESGSGKSSFSKAVCGLIGYEGRLRISGREVDQLGRKEAAVLRQMVFQDPRSSLNPRMTVRKLIFEGLAVLGRDHPEFRSDVRVGDLLESVRLPRSFADKLPDEMSGGQRQRVAIARSLAARPRLLVCDEALSSLDVTTQLEILKLLAEIRKEFSIGMLFVAHDLAMVHELADNVTVLRAGVIEDQGPTKEVFRKPGSTYTAELLSAIPVPDPVAQRQRREAREALARSRRVLPADEPERRSTRSGATP